MSIRTPRPLPAAIFCAALASAAGCAPAIPPVPPAPLDAVAASVHSPRDFAAAIDTMDGAVAMDFAAESSNARVLPPRTYDCSEAAQAVGRRAQELAEASRRNEARTLFAEALATCPANARWWIDAGDIELREGRLDEARRMIGRGLAIEPWDRDGHRYLSYVEKGLGNEDESWRQAVLAVVSDPTCETCWALLRKTTEARGGTFARQYEKKPVARAAEGRLDLELDPVREISRSKGWVAYAIGLGTRELRLASLATPAEGKPLRCEKIDLDWASWSPLERERWLVQTTLADYRPEADRRTAGRTPKTWPVIKSAVDEGYLDEAIFMQLLDAALVPEFVTYRAKHAERLVDHVTSFLAVLPSGVGRRRSSESASLQDRNDSVSFLRDSIPSVKNPGAHGRGFSLAPRAPTVIMPS